MKGKNFPSNTEIERLKKIEKVADEVIEKIGNPVSPLQVSAVIESLGYRHADCPTEFGKKNIFELSKDVYKICKLKVRRGKAKKGKTKQLGFLHSFWIFIRYFSGGIALGLPIASQIAFIAFTGYSLWAWIKFTELQATIVALGTILSFIVTGGFTQVIGREVTYYLSIGNKITARAIAFKLFNYGFATSIAFGFLLFILNLVFEIFPKKFLLIALVYYFLLSILWLSTSLIYSAKRKLAVFTILSIGTLVVIWLHKFNSLNIHIAHIIGLTTSDVLMTLWARFIFRLKKGEKKITYVSLKVKRRSVLAYVNSPFFKFGLYYFLLLFLDRLISWSAPSKGKFYLFWFRTPYELGVDWALLSFGLMLAMLEYTVNDFSEKLIPTQKKFPAFEIKSHNAWYLNFYLVKFSLLVIFGLASIIAVYLIVMKLGEVYQHIKEVREFFSSPITFKVFYLASISYLFLAIGLLNNLFFFTLWKPEFGLKAIRSALLVDLVVGLISSRLISWEYGVLGFTLGSLVFAITTTWHMLKFLKTIDYQYYSAF
ncbi:hypothetical protein JGI1_00354 [Candidatus Thermokryptus mobilis]|uniref:Membrane protein involved in the export of O-antigen and teichoic acid n=1 Tax=Candidatus Thermokryptus mobilis TaxID=1643428 RepID=A0A0S4MT03_9BACT|nr:hypothetical protein [Candidatus Thermokryptus mobilis]CUU01849.1 hypothetical protein JGI1_00354 [Candidatus Thermokryptus mobilis]